MSRDKRVPKQLGPDSIAVILRTVRKTTLAVFCIGLFFTGASHSLPCEPWQPGEPFPFGERLYDIVKIPNLWVAVGRNGVVATSPDGVVWTKGHSGYTKDLFEVAGHAGRLIAVGGESEVVISDDGFTWQSAPPIPLEDVDQVLWSDGLFIAVGRIADRAAGIAISKDGVNWTITYQRPNTPDFTTVVKTDLGLLVSGEFFTGVVVRGDGWTWEVVQDSYGFEQMASSGNITVATHQDGNLGWSLYWSDDGGEDWTWATYPDQHLRFPKFIWTGHEFLAFGECDTHYCKYSPFRVFRSLDGKVWEDIDVPTDREMHGAATTSDLAVFVGDWGAIKTWSNSEGWSAPSPGESISLYRVASSGTNSVAVGAEGFGAVTTDGETWEPFRISDVFRFEDVLWSPPTPDHPAGRFLAVGWHNDPETAVVASSADGLSWEVQSLFPGVRLFGVTETSFGFVAVGYGPGGYTFASLRSLDGVNWTYHGTPLFGYWYSKVAWNGKTLVATSDIGLYVSTDGITWKDVSPADWTVTYMFWDVASDGTDFVAIGEDWDHLGTIWSSPDGQTWRQDIERLQLLPRNIESIGSRYLISGTAREHRWGILEPARMLWYSLDGSIFWPDLSKLDPMFYSGTSLMGDKIVAVDYYGRTAFIDFSPEPKSPRIIGPNTVCSGDTATLETNPLFSDALWSTGETTPSIIAPFADLATYQATGTDFQGCRMTTPVHTVTGSLTPTPWISGPTMIAPGEQAELVATAGYAGYFWSTGETTSTILVNPIVTTDYTVSVSTIEGCAGVSNVHTVVVDPTLFSDDFESGGTTFWSGTTN